MKKNHFPKIAAIVLISLSLGFINLTPQTKKQIAPFLPDSINNADIKLGLDLQGGAQLDYKIDLREVPESDQDSIVEGVQAVIERRVNSLGVSEPNIFESNIGGERHITVELAGISDLEEAKNTVGKTIQLEFKERKSQAELNDPEYKSKIKEQVQTLLDKAIAGEDFRVLGEQEQQAFQGKVVYNESDEAMEVEDIFPPINLSEEQIQEIKNLEQGAVYNKILETEGYYDLLKINEFIEEQKEVKNEKSVEVSHILVAYQGATRADEAITRTKEEAKARAEEAKSKIAGSTFEQIAKEYSDGPSNENGGKLDAPVKDGGVYDPTFTKASLNLTEGQTSDIVETEFGFHIIKANKVTPESTTTETINKIKFERIIFDNQPDPWKATGLTGENFTRADADFGANQIEPVVRLKFDEEGARLFGEITERNVDKELAIFVGGTMVSSPTVQTKIDSGEAIINGLADIKEAQLIARELNTGAIPAPIVLTGQYTIGSTLGQEALSTSLKAGIIGLILVAIYMIAYYRLAGVLAVLSLSIYAIILLFLIKIALPVAAALLISIAVFIWLIVQTLNSKDSGWEKLLSLVMSTFGLFFLSFLLSTSVVLTLAGVAGVILSIGMAVDANILIFERMKEELKNGRPFSSALEIGFTRAWSSIRDSNFSSLITCGILFYVGTSIIKGFAFNLAAGIVVSMLTAITITRSFMKAFVGSKSAHKKALWAPSMTKDSDKTYKIVENSKTWFSISGLLIALSIAALSTFGLKLGIDFTGGTSMVLKFENEVTKEQLATAINEIEADLKAEPSDQPEATSFLSNTAYAQQDAPVIESNNQQIKEIDEEVDFGQATIVESSEGYLIKLKHISEEVHEALKQQLTSKLGNFEEIRFNTIGPTVGSTMKYRAVVALSIALLAIVFYVSFAFRKIPAEYSPWRFGLSAIVALTHDVLIAAGIFAVLGHYLNVEIDILFVTALLTIIGFSVHDTIVVLDRLRENLRIKDSKEEFSETTNKALTQTMARSINTSVSTLITLLALYLLGSQSIQWFVLALIIGTIVGTYSSIFTASPILVAWHKRNLKK